MRIRNWKRFQHFKDRRPPWIRLYRDLLDDDEWADLDGEAAKLLVMLWLLASEAKDLNGELPTSVKKLAFRLRVSESYINKHLPKLSNWLEQGDDKLISDCHQLVSPETETETEADAGTTCVVPDDITPVWSGKKMRVSAADHAKLIAVYDERLAMAEYPKADLWLQNNPRRSRSNIAAFMASWLERAAARAPKGGGAAAVVFGSGGNYV